MLVFQHTFPVNDMDVMAVYYSYNMIAYFKPEGISVRTILLEFYHQLVCCYGGNDMLDPVTGYYARNDTEGRVANSYAETFVRMAIC